MKSLQPTTRYLAALFLVLTLHSLVLGFLEQRSTAVSVRHQVEQADSIVAGDDLEQVLQNFFKPPKHSFIDYTNFFDPRCLIPVREARSTRLVPLEPLSPWLQVYAEIIVPPDCSA